LATNQSNEFTLIKAARIFDGTGSPASSGKAVLLNDGQIAAIGAVGELSAPDGANLTIKDYGDATILPGLVDGHTHMMAPGDGTHGDITGNEQDDVLLMRALQNARIFLHAGVTTARENGAKNRVGFSLKEGIQRGLSEGPEMVVSGRPITITGGHFWYCGSEADGVEGVRSEVRKLIKEGADFIKIMATGGSTWSSNPLQASYTVEEMAVIVEEAHRFGKLTAAHCASMQGIKNALDAGVDMIIHCVFEDVRVQRTPRRAARCSESMGEPNIARCPIRHRANRTDRIRPRLANQRRTGQHRRLKAIARNSSRLGEQAGEHGRTNDRWQ